MMSAFYNEALVERQHEYFCRLGNSNSCNEYTQLLSKDTHFRIRLFGRKSGTTKDGRKSGTTKDDLTFLQPSHLQVSVAIDRSCLPDGMSALDVSACSWSTYSSHESKCNYTFHDVDAFRDFIKHFPQYETVVPFIVKMFEDWVNLDAIKERRAARIIQEKALEKIWSPENDHFRKHVQTPCWQI